MAFGGESDAESTNKLGIEIQEENDRQAQEQMNRDEKKTVRRP